MWEDFLEICRHGQHPWETANIGLEPVQTTLYSQLFIISGSKLGPGQSEFSAGQVSGHVKTWFNFTEYTPLFLQEDYKLSNTQLLFAGLITWTWPSSCPLL